MTTTQQSASPRTAPRTSDEDAARTAVEAVAPQAYGAEPPIIFFDGVCGFCNASVNLVLRADRRGVFRFAPLQGPTAARMLPAPDPDPARWSMMLIDGGETLDRSDAALAILRRLGGVYALLSWLRIIPRPIRDFFYRLVAVSRYRIFGRHDACRVPTAAERDRFLP